jgi:hypothetical protein
MYDENIQISIRLTRGPSSASAAPGRVSRNGAKLNSAACRGFVLKAVIGLLVSFM